jgi:site-specific recombinase XerD
VFPRLHEEDFETVLNNDNFSGATEIQYRKINRASIVYNRHLKQLQEHLGMKKTLKTHLPRTSFTNLMMKGKVNHRDISNTLGHSSISVTDEYLKTGFTNDGVNSVIKGTSDDFKSE